MQQPKPAFIHPDDRPQIEHDVHSAPLTLARQTDIRMPMLEEETRFTALFVLGDDVPTKMINEVLELVYKEMEVHEIWVADTILPEGLTDEDDEATVPPINQTWHSPFAGQPIEEAFRFLASVPPEKSLNRDFLIVLDRTLYDREKWIVLYRIDERGEITSAPCAADMSMVYVDSYNWHLWPTHLESWRKHGDPIFKRVHGP